MASSSDHGSPAAPFAGGGIGFSGIGEVIRVGETGRLVPLKDAVALAQAIKARVSDRKVAIKLAERGWDLVFRQFDSEENYGKMLELFHNP